MDEITQTNDQIIKLRLQNIFVAMVEEGMNISEACDKYGISTKTYNRHLAKFPDVAAELFREQELLLKERFLALSTARLNVVDQIIVEAEDVTELGLKDLLPLEKRLKDLIEEMKGSVDMSIVPIVPANSNQNAAADYLSTQPVLRRITERIYEEFSSDSQTPSITSNPVIEGETKDVTD